MKQLLLILVLVSACSAAEPTTQPVDTRVEVLRQFKPLPKIHYSWARFWDQLSEELVYEYARISGALCTSDLYHAKDIDLLVKILAQVNATNPKMPATLGVNYSAWHRKYKTSDPTDFGELHDAELAYWDSYLDMLELALQTANTKYETNVSVSAFLLDSELFTYGDDQVWNASIDVKYNLVCLMIYQRYPAAKVVWYSKGSCGHGPLMSGERRWDGTENPLAIRSECTRSRFIPCLSTT